jgi:sarcosine oxidase subunit gamma
MATTTAPRSFPFQPGGAAEGTPLPSGCITLGDLTALPRFGLKGPGSAAWLTAAGVPLPPVNRVCVHRGMRVLRLGGEDILLSAETGEPPFDEIRAAWEADTGSKGYSSWREEGWAWMRLSGPALGPALARLCALDLRPGRFGDDEISQTRFAGVEAVLLRAADALDIFFDVTASAFVARTVAAVEKRCVNLQSTGEW